jgi:hypothetical protein
MNANFAVPCGAMRRRSLLVSWTAAALLALAGITPALADSRLVQVEVLDRDSGDMLHVYRDHGRPVVAGGPGARYSVRLVNTSGERVLAVVAIDGVNVISGETASVAQRGYVLEPWQRTEITGWRKSDDEVAMFEFTALADSYAARTGRPLDVGVIGVAVFREAPASTQVSKAAPPTRLDAQSGAMSERLGTGHGARETSVVRVTTFQRASAQPDQRLEIRYDSLDNLVAAGIVPPPRVPGTWPHSFPADPPRDYVPDPPLR